MSHQDAGNPAEGTKGGFMFVEQTGQQSQAKDQAARKKLRSHVMYNVKEQQRTSTSRAKTGEEARTGKARGELAAAGGQKLRFRLGNGKLVESIPYRNRRKVKKAGNVTTEEGATGKRPEERANDDEVEAVEDVTSGDFEDHDFDLTHILSELDKSFALPEAATKEYTERNTWEPAFPGTSNRLQIAPFAETALLPASVLRPVSTTRLDPLNVLPFMLSRRDEALIDRFQQWNPDSYCPVNGRGIWFRHAMRDELMFHATMYHWGMHFARSDADFHIRNPEVIEHKLSAFRMINSRLNDAIDVVKDETIAAVAAIVNIEISFGNRTEAAKHMTGLEAIVNLRGGIETLDNSMEGLLSRFVGWNDLNHAELFGTSMRFQKMWHPHDSDEEWDADHGPCFRRVMAGLGADQPLVWQPLQGDVISKLHKVRQLCEVVSEKSSSSLREEEKVKRSDVFHAVERELRQLAVPEQVDPILESPTDRVWRAIALAGLLYVHYMLRGLPLAYRQFNSLSRDLQIALALTGGPQQVWQFTPEILVWALTTGTMVSASRMEHGWYVERLVSACRACGYDDWEKYRQAMKSFLWVGRLDSGRYRKVWDEVEPELQNSRNE